jgi:hypothetical protein
VRALCALNIRGVLVLATCGITPRSSFLLVARLFPFSLELRVPETGHNARCCRARKVTKTTNIRESRTIEHGYGQAMLPTDFQKHTTG